MATPKINFRVDIAVDLAESVDARFEQLGQTRVMAVTHLLELFLKLPEYQQRAVLGQVPSDLGVEILRLMLVQAESDKKTQASSPEPSPKFIPAKMERIPGPTVTRRKRESSKTHA